MSALLIIVRFWDKGCQFICTFLTNAEEHQEGSGRHSVRVSIIRHEFVFWPAIVSCNSTTRNGVRTLCWQDVLFCMGYQSGLPLFLTIALVIKFLLH